MQRGSAILQTGRLNCQMKIWSVPYENRKDLPESVRKALSRVPHAQDIYKEAFNSALKQYKEEGRAHAVAWHAVKRAYKKGSDGKWRARG